MRTGIIVFLLSLFLVGFVSSSSTSSRRLNQQDIVKLRCSLNPQEETFYFFNGSVYAYSTTDRPAAAGGGNKLLFNTVGINVARCFKNPANNLYTLASRELLYYLDPVTNKIIDKWTNPEGETVTVAHVDNDPALQSFPSVISANAFVVDGKIVFNTDVTTFTYYANPLQTPPNATFDPYSPLTYYQAGEFFKFISPVDELDNPNLNAVASSLVSWTRVGPWLPWMKRGNAPGFLMYSSQGSKIDSWEDIPAPDVKADIQNRVPHYQNAPECAPLTGSVTSWTFFKAHFQDYLNGAQFPLSTPAQYGCQSYSPATPPSPPPSSPPSHIPTTRNLSLKDVVKLRCSLNPEDEIFYWFNGTVYGYSTDDKPAGNKVLFNTIGINVGRCFLNASGTYVLASRELMYYLDPVTNQIIDTWTNYEGENVTVVHVDNDPVIQVFYPSVYPAMVVDGDVIFVSDVVTPLYYPNPLQTPPNSTFAPYSPKTWYQAAELFKFFSPVEDLDNPNLNTVSSSIVSWTRNGPWLPWMKRGNAPGYLVYSAQGSRIDSWEDLPAGVKYDFETRIPHYKHAPSCYPKTPSVTSWSFFKAHFQEYLDGVTFPLAEAAQYGCVPNNGSAAPTTPVPTQKPTELPTQVPTEVPSVSPTAPSTGAACRVSVDPVVKSTWVENGQVHRVYDIQFTNTGTKTITEIKVSLENTPIEGSWNIPVVSGNVHKPQLWNLFEPSTKLDNKYGFIGGANAVITVVDVKCLN